jgi:hypothetical protein
MEFMQFVFSYFSNTVQSYAYDCLTKKRNSMEPGSSLAEDEPIFSARYSQDSTENGNTLRIKEHVSP